MTLLIFKVAAATAQQREQGLLFKLVLVGESAVGKSNLLSRYTRDAFNAESISTVGVEFATKIVTMHDRKVRAQIWDTAGQERMKIPDILLCIPHPVLVAGFRSITTAYYRGALGAMLVFDVTSMQSFENIRRWHHELRDHANDSIVCMLVGNKIDETAGRVVSTEAIAALSEELGLDGYFECSAKSGENVESAFTSLLEKIFDKHVSPPTPIVRPSTDTINPSSSGPRSTSCCSS